MLVKKTSKNQITLPKEIIKNLTKPNAKDVHNMEFEVGNKTYYLIFTKFK